MRALKVAVVMGGNSPEHDISLQSGATVLAHLPESKYERTAVVVQPGGSWCLAQGALNHEELSRLHGGLRPEEAVTELRAWGIDAAFLALHGPNGEDGSIQGFFQVMGIPYTGSDVESSAITLNKYVSKAMMASWGGVLIPPYRMISLPDWEEGGEESLFPGLQEEVGFPAFVKPLRSGSSLGTRRIEKPEDLKNAVEHGFLFDEQLLFEKEIPGREIRGRTEP